jgi:SAM-dependent methyltransferase
MSEIIVSQMDVENLTIIRRNIVDFMKRVASAYAAAPGTLLDIAPQDHEGAAPYFPQAKIYTLDINPQSNVDYIADICQCNNELIPENYFDWVVCTEVLEHTLKPFAAVKEITRILKPDGFVFISTPFNFRIHGPLPDCWRFTEHGLRALLEGLKIIELQEVPMPGRHLMPIHYTVVAQKPR